MGVDYETFRNISEEFVIERKRDDTREITLIEAYVFAKRFIRPHMRNEYFKFFLTPKKDGNLTYTSFSHLMADFTKHMESIAKNKNKIRRKADILRDIEFTYEECVVTARDYIPM